MTEFSSASHVTQVQMYNFELVVDTTERLPTRDIASNDFSYDAVIYLIRLEEDNLFFEE